MDSLLKGFSIDALFLYFITASTGYEVTNAAGTTWATYIQNLSSNANNLVMSSYTESNYMLYNFYGITNPYRLKGYLGVNYQFSSFITSLDAWCGASLPVKIKASTGYFLSSSMPALT